MKHRETFWITIKHGHETPWIRMEQCFMVMKHIESGWNSMFHGHETHCCMPMKHLESGTATTAISIFLYWFLVRGVSWCFTALFHAVSLMFHAVSCCFILFHGVALRCFMLFQCCFIAVSCCFIAVWCCFIAVSRFSLLCFILFTVCHRSVSWCIKVFHCHIASCFMTMKQVQWERAFSGCEVGGWLLVRTSVSRLGLHGADKT